MAGWVVVAAAAQTFAGSGAGTDLAFNRTPVGVVVETVLKRVSTEPFVICDEVLRDKREVSLRFAPYQLNTQNLARMVRRYGYRLTIDSGSIVVCPPNATTFAQADVPAGNPIASPRSGSVDRTYSAPPPVVVPSAPASGQAATSEPANGAVATRYERREVVSYSPSFGEPAAVAAAVNAVVDGGRATVAEVRGRPGVLIFTGSPDAVEQFRTVARAVDLPPVVVDVEAVLVEVQVTQQRSSGLSLVGSILSDALKFDVRGDSSANRVALGVGPLDAIVSALGGDNRVRVVSAPALAGVDGAPMRLSVGEEVPTISAIVENVSGSQSQSVIYRDSGVILELTARTSANRALVDLRQELSSFAATRFGVQGSPTLAKREVRTVLDLPYGEWAAVGGLRATTGERGKTTFLGLPIGSSRSTIDRDLVLLLRVMKRGSPVPTQEGRANPDAG